MNILELFLDMSKDGVNELTGPTNDWSLAIIDEATEVLAELPWKWYKKETTEIDTSALMLEVCDVLFTANKLLRTSIAKRWTTIDEEESITEIVNSTAISMYTIYMEEHGGLQGSQQVQLNSNKAIECTKSLIHGASGDTKPQEVVALAFQLMFACGLKIKDLHKYVLGKYALVYFRQQHGINDGSYNKVWVIDAVAREDNYHMMDIIDSLDDNISHHDLAVAVNNGLVKLYTAAD